MESKKGLFGDGKWSFWGEKWLFWVQKRLLFTKDKEMFKRFGRLLFLPALSFRSIFSNEQIPVFLDRTIGKMAGDLDVFKNIVVERLLGRFWGLGQVCVSLA